MKLEELNSNKKYEIIYCDPPWDYKGQVQTGKGGVDSDSAQKHYACIKLPNNVRRCLVIFVGYKSSS